MPDTSHHDTFSRGRSLRISLAGVALVGATVAYVLATSSSTPASGPADGPSDAAVAAIPLLDDPQQPSDELPSFLVDGPQSLDGIIEESTQRLGTDDDTTFWVAANGSSETCLILLFPGADEVAAMTCQPVSRLTSHGIQLEANDQSHEVRALLAPDGYTDDGTDVSQVGDNLFLQDPDLPAPEELASTDPAQPDLDLVPAS